METWKVIVVIALAFGHFAYANFFRPRHTPTSDGKGGFVEIQINDPGERKKGYAVIKVALIVILVFLTIKYT